jgi:hypothetical protein
VLVLAASSSSVVAQRFTESQISREPTLSWTKSRVRYFTAVLNFLDRHIGHGLSPVGPASEAGSKE